MSRLFLIALFAAASACAAAPADPEGVAPEAPSLKADLQESDPEPMPTSPPEPAKPEKQPDGPAYKITPEGVAGLPSADGKTFAALDDYLAHLEKKGHHDHPFWELMKDGKYRWNTGRGMQFREPKYATREKLMKEYGFDELP